MSDQGFGPADYYADGDYNALCSLCGHKFKASQLRKHWQGLYRCEKCWEPRQPQDFVKAVPDIQTPPWVQDPGDILTYTCSYAGQTAYAGLAIAGCMIAGNIPSGMNPNDYELPSFDVYGESA